MRGSIGMLAMTWLTDAATTEAAAERGMPAGLASYAAGRLGVLGDCPPDNVVAAAYFWEPERMRSLVLEARDTITPAAGASIYAEICQAWGESNLGDFEGVERLGSLCERVVESADPRGAALFVGWRDLPLPPPGPGRTFQLCQTMRELRFGRHTVAVQASAMSPLDAILPGPAGEWNAEFFGWPKPYPDRSHLTEQRSAVEDLTDTLHAPDFDVLDAAERQELRDLAKAARAHVG